MPRISSIPNSAQLDWHDTTGPDGRANRTVAVTQQPLKSALEGNPSQMRSQQGWNALSRFLKQADKPETLSDEAIQKAKVIEGLQQRVSQMMPMRPNNKSSMISATPEDWSRRDLFLPQLPNLGQYSAGRAKVTVRGGFGVCHDHGNVLFRVFSERNERALREHSQLRLRERMTMPKPKQVKVQYVINQKPHGLIIWGDLNDPVQKRNALVGDSWEGLPIVKSWSNFEQNMLPFTVKGESLAGTRDAVADLSLEDFAEIESTRPRGKALEQAREAEGLPAVHEHDLVKIFDVHRHRPDRLFDDVSLAVNPTQTYRNAETGEIFIPTLNFHDYQKHRFALSNPLYSPAPVAI